jgi:hypothetical protein
VHNPDAAYWEGHCAYLDGIRLQDNPYAEGSAQRGLWADGWVDGEGAFRDAMEG